MDGFLVVIHHTMDDLPVGLFDKYEIAEAVAKDADWSGFPYREVLDTDASTPISMSIIEFKSGQPVKKTFVRHVG